jgi:hypothetical protein
MKRLARTLAAWSLLALLVRDAAAQLEYGGAPASAVVGLTGNVPTVELPPVDVDALRLEDALRAKYAPFRFGWEHEVALSNASAGVWETLADGARVWRLRVRSAGAYSISLLFERFQLPAGGELFVYDDARATLRGVYTYLNHNVDGGFAIQPVAGEALTLEYVEPRGADSRGEIRLSGVVHDYVDLLSILSDQDSKSGGGSGAVPCETDVNCPEGNAWRDQIDAVTLVIIGGSLCSGSLLNNTASDGTQYYMCAHHCGGLNNAVFRFNYQLPNCGSGTAPTNQTVQGSTELGGSSSLDFRLVRVTPAIPLSYGHFFCGWDRSATVPASTTCVHHPQGGVKKISFDYDPPNKQATQWNVDQWDLGVTEPGSSGSPLYTPQGRFIGQLYGGASYCGFPFDDYYGRFDLAWPSISTYLDPLGSGATTIDGFDPNGGGGAPPVAQFVGAPTSGLAPLVVAFTDQSTGFPTSWAWDFGDGASSTSANPAHTFASPGSYTVSLTATNANGSDGESKADYVVVSPAPQASCTPRNDTGDVNPNVLSCVSLPVIGSTWTAQIDAGSIGGTGLTIVIGMDQPILGGAFTNFGYLLIDLGSTYLTATFGIVIGGTSTHNQAIANDASLIGLKVYTQGYVDSVGGFGKLTNALDLCLGG